MKSNRKIKVIERRLPRPILLAQAWICPGHTGKLSNCWPVLPKERRNKKQKLRTPSWDPPGSFSQAPAHPLTHRCCNSASDSLLPPRPTSHSSRVAQQDLVKSLRPTQSFHYITPPRDWPWNHLTWSWRILFGRTMQMTELLFSPLLWFT